MDETNKDGQNTDVKPPVSAGDYQESLKNLSHQEIVAGLVKAGRSLQEAEEFANEVDEDR